MARDPAELSRLARELAALTPEERAQVIAEATGESVTFKPIPPGWQPPKLSGGGEWTGGSLRREEFYDDDGR